MPPKGKKAKAEVNIAAACSAQPAVAGLSGCTPTEADRVDAKRHFYKGRRYCVQPGKEEEALGALKAAWGDWKQQTLGHSEWLDMHKDAIVPFSRAAGGRRRKGECVVAKAPGGPTEAVAAGTNVKRIRLRAKTPACHK